MPITGAATRGDPDADLEGALADWRRFRRRSRLQDLHWIDALYQAYLAALLSGVAILAAASIVGDKAVSTAGVAQVRADGAAWIGCLAAAAVGLGLRSGSRGGPLALERADVRHALLSPVDRVTALRSPALHQLRFLCFVAAVAGATAGHLADRRLPGNGVAWTVCGTVTLVVIAVLAHGAACCAAGLRLRPWLAAILAVALAGWAVADALGAAPSSPGAVVGRLTLWPLHVDLVGLVPVSLAGVVAVAGLRLLGGLSLEQLERRSRLVGQLRFAATLQDLRTVVVLRRQLAQERPRNHPWFRPPLPERLLPVFTRDARSLLRWPAGRLARLVTVGALGGLAARAAFDGTTPFIVLAGVAFFVASLDAAEPLGQELDHPTLRDSVPAPAGWLYVRHLPAIAGVAIATAAIGAVAAVLVDPRPGAWPVALVCVVPAGLGAAAGAVVNLVMGAPEVAGSSWSLVPPEAAGMRLVARTAFPPAMATLGLVPVLTARAALDGGRSAVDGAIGTVGPLVAVFVLTCGWVRLRDDIKAWWRGQMEQAFPAREETS